ncbi:1,4-dihydroxy-2-naphthoate prenyltransferase [Streptococcus infantis]|uniref:1,4-dihydroxy-2-naphthoate prenyltransferase n=1 Tax=Streptococcus infantis TaxID=68892 RepID=UPI001CBDEC90|nr:1,4-dihydroxy-2-naphthoate prenyltransferase [Streptococcus infantis]MBZ2119402.1 1,4-dihydroxy-2-naphthoate prenyltransferase [Streptococcus infantis]MBZ2121226.1 1,4-dihydroxy-2-naphthoate prenyltransferase [Streptococcus infantis]MBZ2125000.1 1,4-dihydroxy-2-naphthoate prenyltransferase [Streptococcus infantis]
MRLVVSDKILKLSCLLVAILWLSPTLIEFTVSLGSQTYSWSAFVLLFLLPIIGFIYLILAILTRKWWLILIGLACLFSFFISMFLGYLFLGP